MHFYLILELPPYRRLSEADISLRLSSGFGLVQLCCIFGLDYYSSFEVCLLIVLSGYVMCFTEQFLGVLDCFSGKLTGSSLQVHIK